MVDFLRQCGRSKWRLHRESTRLTSGFYYKAVPGTPHYPGPHIFGSLIYTKEPGREETPLGEQSGSWASYSGEPPRRMPLPKLVGSPDCIANGFTDNGVVPLTTVQQHGYSLPLACYREVDTSEFDVLKCRFAFKVAKVIEKLYESEALGTAEALAQFGPDGIVSTLPEGSGDFLPACLIWIYQGVAIICVTGTTTGEQGVAQAASFNAGPQTYGLYTAADIYEMAARRFTAWASDRGAGLCSRVIITGHSYGAATACIGAAKAVAAGFPGSVELLTLATPKPGGDSLWKLLDKTKQMHYANWNDPVPYVVPQDAGFVWIMGVPVPNALSENWSKFRRPRKLRVIHADDTFLDTTTELFDDGTTRTLVQGLIALTATPLVAVHSVNYYRANICRACHDTTKPCDPAVPLLLP